MSLHFANEAPGLWAAHDETGDYKVCQTRTGTEVHIDVHGPAGDEHVDIKPRDSMAGFDLCQEYWAVVHHAQLNDQTRTIA